MTHMLFMQQTDYILLLERTIKIKARQLKAKKLDQLNHA